ncbi:acyltransferase [Liquorilactobacillus sicerae]|uniref:acyltransferase n=1 Tax=Liquorilactobacillus sicerae TaxID=1416943 RepID=UPI00248145B9|nr:acyltransferase [Liquorilactobacillus sicerae]
MIKKRKHPYLYEVDLMRCIFIFGVLANHTTSAFIANISASYPRLILLATHLMLHFTRMGFMFITGLVLFLQHYNDLNMNLFKFWKKRYKGSGIPYLFWNGFFLLFAAWMTGEKLGFSTWLGDWLWAVIHGDHFYMYYILVTFQLYLIFPIMLWLFRKFPNYHLLIFVISALVQLFFLIWAKYIYPIQNHDHWPYLIKYYGNFVLSYQFYFIAGAFTSIHYQQVKKFFVEHQKIIYSLTGLLALGTFGLYYVNDRILKLSQHYTELIHQPYLMIYASMMICSVLCISWAYDRHRLEPKWQWFSRLVAISSKISFGVYLTQTFALTFLLKILAPLNGAAPNWLLLLCLPFGYLFVLGGTWLISYFCYKVPPFGILIGRPQKIFGRK